MSKSVKYPNIKVRLTGRDGNAFVIMCAVTSALKKAGAPKAELDLFREEALSGDYNNLLRTCMNWVVVS